MRRQITLSDSLRQLLDTSYELLGLSNEIMLSCRLKKNKTPSGGRFIISFFLRRAQETFEAFLTLIKELGVVDASLLLRSFTELGINTAFIFQDDDEKAKRSLQYIIDGDDSQRRLIESNLEAFKEFDPHIESRKDQLRESIQRAKLEFAEKYPGERPDLPPLKERAIRTEIAILDHFYNQAYRYYSSVEHSTMQFGRDYIDEHECEPLDHLEKIEDSSLFNPKVMLFLFRSIFFEILKTFNNEYLLNWEEKIITLFGKHESEYGLLKKK
jgi:hypothetical protein